MSLTPLAGSARDLHLLRLPEHRETYPEIKDPSLVRQPDGSWLMFASIGNSANQHWIVGRFRASHPSGPWQEIPPVSFPDLSGPQLCAPAVRFSEGMWTMYVQTACFEADGHIAVAHSVDSQTFYSTGYPLITTSQLRQNFPDIIGVYDAGISEITLDGSPYLSLLFSGYRRIGCGDLYLTYRPKHGSDNDWSPAIRLLSQEDVPFHNHPDYSDFEWGLEGAQIIQLPGSGFLLVGVCFLPKPNSFLGTRQRVFMAYSQKFLGSYQPISTPIEPAMGENGHPDAFIFDRELWLTYQERHGKDHPWFLKSVRYDLTLLSGYLTGSYGLPRSAEGTAYPSSAPLPSTSILVS